MSKLIVYFGDNPECIEGFSTSCSRSVEGALHLKPRKHVTVTDDEFSHIMQSRVDLKGKIRVVADKPDQQAEASKPAESVQTQKVGGSVEKPKDMPEPVEEDKFSKKKKF